MPNNEFGDFQTHRALADRVVGLLRDIAQAPATVVEPTCGKGSFVRAALNVFPNAVVHGLEIQKGHVRELERQFQFKPNFVPTMPTISNSIGTISSHVWRNPSG